MSQRRPSRATEATAARARAKVQVRRRPATRAETLRQRRAAHRGQRYRSSRGDVEPGLSFLQTNKVKPPTRTAFRERVRNFVQWARIPDINSVSVQALDELATQYLDVLFFDGMEGGEGSRLLAAMQYMRPGLGTARQGNFPLARAALAGYRRHSHAQTRDPLAKPWVVAMVGLSVLCGQREYATALWLAWDGMLRLPSDLVGMTTRSLVGPGRGQCVWALLLYPSSQEARSKTMGFDEGVILQHPAWKEGAGRSLQATRAARQPGSRLWSFDAPAFNRRFEALLAALPEAPVAIPYQVRHGAASHAAALESVPLTVIGARLRRTNPNSSLRYAKHVRYLGLLNDAPAAVAAWAEWVEPRLGPLLSGQLQPKPPSFTLCSSLEQLRAIFAVHSVSGSEREARSS